MRAPKRHRPLHRKVIAIKPPREILLELAEGVSYIGSPEHKRGPSFAGRPIPRADASICPPALASQKKLVESWLKNAILEGTYSEEFTGRFPRYVWHSVDGQFYEGRLTNQVSGEYKGYPIGTEESPL